MTSCGNCSQLGVELEDAQYTILTVFGSLELEITVCKTCKSAMDFCQLQYYELNDFLAEKLSDRANQLNHKLKRTMK